MSKYLRWALLAIVFLTVVNFGVKAYRGSRLKQKAKEISTQHAQLLGTAATLGSAACNYDSKHAVQRCYINYKASVPYNAKKQNELISSLESDGWQNESSKDYRYRRYFYERACDVTLEQKSGQLDYELACYH